MATATDPITGAEVPDPTYGAGYDENGNPLGSGPYDNSNQGGAAGNYQTEVQPTKINYSTPDISNFDYSRIQANPGETAAQTIARYQNDYHAPDADVVNAALASGGYQSYLNSKSSATPAASSGSDTFDGSLGSVTSLLQASGFGSDDPNYWYQRIQQTGGNTPGNLAYWEARIKAGPAGEQPGGAYYEGGTSSASASSSPGTGNPQIDAATNDAILQLLQEGEAPVNPNDLTIAGPTAAFRNEAQYGADRNREALAEQAAQEGVGSGALDTAIQSGNEKAAMDTANYAGGLTQQAIATKLQQLNTALQFASGKDAQALQLQIAQLQAQLQQQSITNQNTQYYDTEAYNVGKDNATFDYLYNNLAGE